MVVDRLVPRLAQQRLREALADSPVVLVHGPRQCGKTALTQMTCAPSALERGARSTLRSTTSTEAHISGDETHAYITFDDLTVVEAARSDPMGFVDRLPPRVVLDEVQRVPELYTAIKLAVDRDRSPGRFVLTGSTNLLLMPTLADSLVGRMQIVRMHPLTQRELSTEPHAGDAQADETGMLPSEGADFLDTLFSGGFRVTRVEPERSRLADRIAAEGYPAAVARPTGARRLNWYSDYLTSVIQRDLPDVSRVRVPDALSRLLEVCATQTASLLNVSNLASQLQISRPTVTEYLSALERLFLVDRLRPWHINRSKRIIKTPKLHLGDARLACALLGVSAADIYQDRKLLGQLTETFVYSELRGQASAHPVGTDCSISATGRVSRLISSSSEALTASAASKSRHRRRPLPPNFAASEGLPPRPATDSSAAPSSTTGRSPPVSATACGPCPSPACGRQTSLRIEPAPPPIGSPTVGRSGSVRHLYGH